MLFTSPRTDEERANTASACVRRLGIELPALLDRIDDGVERAYAGWPDRLYLIGRGGGVRFKSGPGPFGFSPSDLEEAILELRAEEGLSP